MNAAATPTGAAMNHVRAGAHSTEVHHPACGVRHDRFTHDLDAEHEEAETAEQQAAAITALQFAGVFIGIADFEVRRFADIRVVELAAHAAQHIGVTDP